MQYPRAGLYISADRGWLAEREPDCLVTSWSTNREAAADATNSVTLSWNSVRSLSVGGLPIKARLPTRICGVSIAAATSGE